MGNDLNMDDLALAQRDGLGRSLFSGSPSADSRFVYSESSDGQPGSDGPSKPC